MQDKRPETTTYATRQLDRVNSSQSSRGLVGAAMIMLFIAGLPDAMVVPMLRQLLVDRYGVSVGSAHYFMTVNLLGAFVAVALVPLLRSLVSIRVIVLGAALLDAAMLGIMAMPIGFAPTLAVRTVEGFADLLVYAFLFQVIASGGRGETRGCRMSAAATCMMLGIAFGMGSGGIIGRNDATVTLWAGAIACVFIVPLAFLFLPRRPLDRFARRRISNAPTTIAKPRLWPVLMMMFSDRLLAGLLSTTVPLFLATLPGISSAARGGLIGLAMLIFALGTWPWGRIVDRFGALPVRCIGTVFFAGGIASIAPAIAIGTGASVIVMVAIGVGGGALFASSLDLVARTARGASAMAAYYAWGNAGFFVGPVVAAGLLSTFGGGQPDGTVFAAVIALLAACHIAIGVGMVVVIRSVRPSGATDDCDRKQALPSSTRAVIG